MIIYKNIKRLTFFIILIINIISSAAELPVSGRGGGMGDAFIAMRGSSASVYYNPAVIMFQNGITSELCFGWSKLSLPEDWSVTYARPQSRDSYFGLGLIRHKLESQGKSYRSFQALMPVTYSISGNIKSGFNIKYITQKIDAGDYNSKISLDFGSIMKTGVFSFGFMARNFLHPGYYSFPSNLTFGAGLELTRVNLEADWRAGKWEEFNSEDGEFLFGVELKLNEQFYIRCGREQTENRDLWSFGFSLGELLSAMRLDYCFRGEEDNFKAGTHWISYSYSTER
ncbi:MAG: hypothetical protein H8E87_08350 [FCB group bacterium]|nr:hypothetical protein [FCB group bacterium]